MGAALVLPYANAQAVNLHLEGDLQPSDARQSRRLHLFGHDCGTHVIDNIGKKTGGGGGNGQFYFGLSRGRPSGSNHYGQGYGRDNKTRCRADHAAQAPD